MKTTIQPAGFPPVIPALPDHYHLATDNGPIIGSLRLAEYFAFPPVDSRLKEWPEPTWEIVQYEDRQTVILVNRPTDEEAREGDLHGALGSEIRLYRSIRPMLKTALRIARMLAKADPIKGIVVYPREVIGITHIITDIPVYEHYDSLAAIPGGGIQIASE